MKTKILAGSLFLMSLAPTLSAASAPLRCSEASSHKVSDEDGIYTFTATIQCSGSTKNEVTTDFIKTTLLGTLEKVGSVNVENEDAEYKGMSGSQLSYVDKTLHNGSHGDITVTYDAHLVSNDDTVLFHGDSSNIDASGDSENTRAVKIDIKYTVSGTKIKLNITKTADIQIPGLARLAKHKFEDKVNEGLSDEVSDIANTYKSILANSKPSSDDL